MERSFTFRSAVSKQSGKKSTQKLTKEKIGELLAARHREARPIHSDFPRLSESEQKKTASVSRGQAAGAESSKQKEPSGIFAWLFPETEWWKQSKTASVSRGQAAGAESSKQKEPSGIFAWLFPRSKP